MWSLPTSVEISTAKYFLFTLITFMLFLEENIYNINAVVWRFIVTVRKVAKYCG